MNTKRISFVLASALLACFSVNVRAEETPPNVLLIAIDDLNDWIGCMGGHPQAQTPNMDRLAARGMLFNNAHCQSPVCNPSRASMMTSLYPSTSGLYFLKPDFDQSPVAKKNTLLPTRFQDEGYYVTGAGKLFHGSQNRKYMPNYVWRFSGLAGYPKKKISPYRGHRAWDWGVFPERDDQMIDYKVAEWGVEQLKKQYGPSTGSAEPKPLFLGIGFSRPHVPQFAPQKWFDLYPLETLQLPKVTEHDLKDIPEYGVNITRLKHIVPTMEWVEENDQWKPLVQSYLACVSFVDDQVGKLLDALEASPHQGNTYVVLYTDHGFHLGEKERFGKRSLWEDGTRTAMIIAGPGILEGAVCSKPAQLLDIYPTLLELTGLKADPKLEGKSLVPLLKNPQADWPHYARTSFGPGNYSIVSEDYRYIHYNDGSEEFYDRTKDTHEWNNVINNPEYAEHIKKHRAQVPQERYEILGQNSIGHKSFEATEAISRGEPIRANKPAKKKQKGE